MNELIEKYVTEIRELQDSLTRKRNVIEAIQADCEHQHEDVGRDSHGKTHYRCKECGYEYYY